MIEVHIGEEQSYAVSRLGDTLWLNGQPFQLAYEQADEFVREFRLGNRRFRAVFQGWDAETQTLRLRINGKTTELRIRTLEDRLLERIGVERKSRLQVSELKAPMPGLVRQIYVSAGDVIQANDPLITLEAMKMENVLRAPGEGKIAEVLVSPNAPVEKNETLLRFE
jgi:biotin carboxyl carrier protein